MENEHSPRSWILWRWMATTGAGRPQVSSSGSGSTIKSFLTHHGPGNPRSKRGSFNEVANTLRNVESASREDSCLREHGQAQAFALLGRHRAPRKKMNGGLSE